MPTTPKRERVRLAKSELLIHLSDVASQLAQEVTADCPSTIPFDQWPTDDPLRDMAGRYDLKGPDLGKVLQQLADDLCNRALRCGYDDAWVR